ncbi:MAG: thiamine-phosphate synthase family protein [Halobacteriaceae archaeon]
MTFVEEIVVEEFLPTYRALLAEALRERGLTQAEVAAAVGVSQSAVSKYVHGQVSTNDRIAADERVRDLVEEVADGLATGDMSRVGALIEAEVLIRNLEASGDLLATLHEEAVPALADRNASFRVHDPDSELRARERVRASLRRGLRALERTAGFPDLVPNVGTNLVECLDDAARLADVAGVPGRIFVVKGQVSVPGEPEFGVSGHVASVLLAAREAGSAARAALNVRYRPELVDRLRAAGHETAEFDAEREDLQGAVADAVDRVPDATAVYQTGAYGVEPILYLLGGDATDAVGLAADLT